MTWNVSPIMFEVGPLTVRWYGLFFACAFYSGYRVVCRIYKNEGLPEEDVSSLLFHTFWGTVIGARLGQCLFYDPVYYLSHPLEILQIWKGGLASHGAAIGILIAFSFYTRKYPQYSYSWVFDRLVIGIAVAGGFIRLGNLMNSEILGKPANVPWAVVFSRVDPVPRHPAMIYESLIYFASFLILYRYYMRFGAKLRRGSTAGLFLLLIFGSRFFVEFLKEEQAAFHGLPLNVGQFLSLPFMVVGWLLWNRGDWFYDQATRLVRMLPGRTHPDTGARKDPGKPPMEKPARVKKRKKNSL